MLRCPWESEGLNMPSSAKCSWGNWRRASPSHKNFHLDACVEPNLPHGDPFLHRNAPRTTCIFLALQVACCLQDFPIDTVPRNCRKFEQLHDPAVMRTPSTQLYRINPTSLLPAMMAVINDDADDDDDSGDADGDGADGDMKKKMIMMTMMMSAADHDNSRYGYTLILTPIIATTEFLILHSRSSATSHSAHRSGREKESANLCVFSSCLFEQLTPIRYSCKSLLLKTVATPMVVGIAPATPRPSSSPPLPQAPPDDDEDPRATAATTITSATTTTTTTTTPPPPPTTGSSKKRYRTG